jgi:transposase InsO family protein
VFTAQEFVEACEDDKQTQSFSGVGAQHQNAEAERAIQTVMYMARSFMIHAALHWSEDGSDDISLWPFAVDHATWLYNRIPQRTSGITPF